MHLSQLSVENFRSLKSTSIRFLRDANILVGPNNAGKTNILRALQLALGVDIARQRDAISRLDFTDGNRDHSFKITATLVGLSDADVDVFGIDNLEPIGPDGDVISEANDISLIDKHDLSLRITVVGSYDEANEDYSLAWYFSKHEEQEVPVSRAQRRRIGFQYLRGGDASSTWALGLSGSSLIRQLIRQQGSNITKEIAQMAMAVDDLGKTLGENEALSSILDNLSKHMARILPVSQGSLRYGSGKRGGDEIVRGLELIGAFTDSSVDLPFSAHGRGSASSAALMAVLLYATEFQGSIILALEEPEVALHPHLQRLLLRELTRRGVQIIMTTHSPVITAACQPENIVLVQKKQQATISKPLVGAGAQERTTAEHDLNRLLAEAVFSEAVLIVEGETDAAFLDTIDRKLGEKEGWRTLDARGVLLIEAGCCKDIPMVAKRLSRLEIPLFAIADNDPTQPLKSVREWGDSCELYFIWPRHKLAYDLEGVIAFLTSFESLLEGLCTVVPMMDEKEFLTSVAAAAVEVEKDGHSGTQGWFVTEVKSSNFASLASAMSSDPNRPGEEIMRSVLKGAMARTMKKRRHMRLLAMALNVNHIPEQITHTLTVVNQYLNKEIGAYVCEHRL